MSEGEHKHGGRTQTGHDFVRGCHRLDQPGRRVNPEDVRALMGRYYEHARKVISRYGGTLEKFIGDAVMAVFGLPVEGFGNVIGSVIWMQYIRGHWSEIARFRQMLDEICKRVQDIEGAGGPVANGYHALLLMAIVHEDQVEIEALQALLSTLQPEAFKEREVPVIVSMYRDGDFSQFKAGQRGSGIAGIFIAMFSEHEQFSSDAVMELGTYYADDLTLRASNIAKALKADDNEALACAIDEAEVHHLVVHAARMRIVLAKRTGDLSQLERARAVLERLEDRLFLRKLHEVEVMLQVTKSGSAEGG